jgi:paraquat-inducible protein B
MSLPDLPEAEVVTKRSIWRNLSLVWLVPVLAIFLSLGIAWNAYNNRGVLVEITFVEAAGVVPQDTTIRLRDVVIGVVEDVHFTPDLARVVVSARLDKEVAATLADDTQFWVVKPEVSTRGISGLSTVLSGVYIEAAWTPTEGAKKRRFEGLTEAPLYRPGRAGTRVTIRTRDGSLLPPGAPVFYHGVEVGKLDTPRLAPAGETVLVDAFILAPHDRFLTTATRFWDLSGFSVKLGAGGVELDVASLGALISGGVAFETVFAGGGPITENTRFDLFPDEESARASIFDQLSENATPFSIYFGGSVDGLAAGAPVQFRGLKVGEVTAIGAFVEETPRGRNVRVKTVVAIDPAALGLDPETSQDGTRAFLEQAVAEGLRARLTTKSLFSAALQIELVELPDAAPDRIVAEDDGALILPSVASEIPDLNATAEGMLQRIDGLPIEQLIEQAITLMASIEEVASSEGTREAPGALRDLLTDARALIAQDDTQALPKELRETVAELRAIVADLKARGAIDSLVSALERADKAMAGIATASEDFPALVQDLRDLSAKAKELKAEELVAAATKVMDGATALIDTDEMRAIPPSLKQALDQIAASLKELREGGAVDNLNGTLASAREAADAVALATKDLPDLADRLTSIANRADALIASYGARSDFNAETLDMLREVQAAARSVSDLARAIERSPNSLLFGK